MRSKFKWIFTLLVAFTVQFSFAQQKTVTGTVSDELGPVVGANVVIKGTTTGTTTDFNGNYSIQAKQGDVLEISFVGMTNQEVTVGAANQYNVTLTEGVLLDDLVITTALGIKRKEDEIVGSYDVVKTEELTQAAAPNAVQALTGKVSGLQISTTSNSVNSSPRIVINGPKSLTGNQEALIVIDNVVSSATVFQSLPPEVIESVNVIKGQQGAVLYGQDGANGVIVVTTKMGNKEDKLSVSISSSIDLQTVAYLPLRQTRYGQGWYGEQIAVENGSWGAEMDGQLVPVGLPQANGEVLMAPYTGDSDNIKDFFQTGIIKQNTISVGMGNTKSGYARLTLGRQDRDFVVSGDEYKRTNVLFRAGKQFGKLFVDGNVSYFSARTHRAASNPNSGTFALYAQLLQTATNIPVRSFEGNDNNSNWNVYYRSPYWTRDNIRNNNVNDYVTGGLNLKYDLNDNINFVVNSSLRLSTTSSTTYVNAWTAEDDTYNDYSNRITRSSFSDSNSSFRYLYTDFLTNFDYDLTESLNFKANLGFNVNESFSKINQVSGQDLNIENTFYNFDNVLAPDLPSAMQNDYFLDRSVSAFANLDFGYKDYLFLNLAARQQYSSVLDRSVDGVFYPGVGVSFIPTKAFSGLKSDVLNYAKVMASYTVTGNSSAVGAYNTDQIGVTSTGFPIGDLASISRNAAPTDQFIKPEISYTKDFGISLGFFKDRLTFDGQYYYTDTKDLITVVGTSSASSLTNYRTNIGELHNTGYNLDLGFTPIEAKDAEGRDFEWSAKLNYSTYETIVDKVADDADELSLGTLNDQVGVFAVKGEAFPTIKGIGYQRDDQGRVIIDPNSGNPLYTSEFKTFGTSTPDFVLGFTNNLSYKGFKLTTVVDYRHGGVFYSGGKYQLAWTGNLIESAVNGRAGGFIFPNSVYQSGTDTNGNPVYTENTNIVTGGNSYNSYQTYFSNDYAFNNAENNILDKTVFKVREVALSYSLHPDAVKHLGLNSVTFGLNARDLFIWLPSENKFYSDPESNFTTGNAQGLSSIGLYPPSRTYGMSVNVTF
ncbi:SusC/RagA family TonB-linked outer membrane protein [Flavobacterium sp.]|uniref:SusC/RagA family TonB-linked outer membrane protein n=1 Tax=Flavobacterium sp. TaxID=239 RepID=UPI003529495C